MDAPSLVKHRPVDHTRTRFEDVARQKDDTLDVALGAALLSRDVYPDLDVNHVLAELDRLAAPLFSARLEEFSAEEQARALKDVLFGTSGAGFRGNETDYYDPKNSLLSDVLSRRVGIPLTLAIVYCEVARRVGIPARGVGFPGHFLVRIERTGQGLSRPLVIDPFFGGRALEDEELRARLVRVLGAKASEAADIPSHLTAASPRSILVRMLTNLKAIYLTRNERSRAHLAVDRIASLLPLAAGPLVERGVLASQLGARDSAESDLTRALSMHPTDAEERMARGELEKLSKLEKRPSSLN